MEWKEGSYFSGSKVPISSFCVTVFHGDVYCVRVLRSSVARMVSMLLAGSSEDPVLDWCCYLPGNA